MTAVIETERLTKAYGEHRGHHRARPRGRRGRDLRVPRAERRRQDDDDARPARPHPADLRPRRGVRHRDDRRSGRDPPTGRLPARRVRPVRPADRRPDDHVLRRTCAAASTGRTSRSSSSALDLDPSRRFKEYSKGNKQKVGLIVALQHRPDLLILDEPTSGLDPLVQQTFFGSSARRARTGRTIFLSSPHHRRGRPDLRPGGDHPRGPARPGRLGSRPSAGSPSTTSS